MLIFERIIAKVSEDLPELPIGYVPRFYSFRDYVKGFTTNSEPEFQFAGGGLSHAWPNSCFKPQPLSDRVAGFWRATRLEGERRGVRQISPVKEFEINTGYGKEKIV